MKRSSGFLAAAFALAVTTATVLAETWKSLPLMDGECVTMEKDPDTHSRSCALQCAAGGYGVVTAEGKFLKFDSEGNKKALEALQQSEKKDHIRATVEGTLDGDVITVTSIAIE